MQLTCCKEFDEELESGDCTRLHIGPVLVTVTVNLALTLFGASSESVAVQITVVDPIGKVDPEAWSQLTVGVPSSSTPVGAVYVTTAPFGPVAATV